MTSLISLERVRTVLAIGAHSDDIEIGAGGTLLRLAADPGVVIHWVVLTAAGGRTAEAEHSASLYLAGRANATVEIKSFRERYFPYQPEIKVYFDDLGARIQPDLVLAPRTDDLHQDHRIAGELAINTFRTQPVFHYELIKYEGDLVTPNVYVPLTVDQMDRKVAFLDEAFPSQKGRYWWRPETFRGIAAVRGVESRSESGYAEGFHCRKLVIE